MAVPATPSKVDNLRLSPDSRDRLAKLIRLIWAEDPLRDPASVTQHAVDCFRTSAVVVDDRWEILPSFRLGSGDGPLVSFS